MNKIIAGLLLGAVAGLIDVIPMVIQKLPWDANLSAFSMWVVVGFFLSSTNIAMKPFVKGIVVSYLCLLPAAILIAGKEPFSLVPILAMTTILGGLLGVAIHKFTNR